MTKMGPKWDQSRTNLGPLRSQTRLKRLLVYERDMYSKQGWAQSKAERKEWLSTLCWEFEGTGTPANYWAGRLRVASFQLFLISYVIHLLFRNPRVRVHIALCWQQVAAMLSNTKSLLSNAYMTQQCSQVSARLTRLIKSRKTQQGSQDSAMLSILSKSCNLSDFRFVRPQKSCF